jgi:hypothetical protein
MGQIGMKLKNKREQQADPLGSTDQTAECDKNRGGPEAEDIFDSADFMKVRTILKGTGPYPYPDPKQNLSVWRNLRRRFGRDADL